MGFCKGTYVPVAGKCLHTKLAKYRSSYELAFIGILEKSPKVLHWDYEYYHIMYMYRGRKHCYIVDFNVELANGMKLLIEIKPRCFYDRAMLRHDMNWHKWNAATSFCTKHNMKFKVIDEVSIPALRAIWS